jgi:SOS response regulatory protein OraA/RecX
MTATLTLSPAAERMRRSRQRRRDGLRSLRVELRETEIDALVRKGLLRAESRDNADAVLRAFYAFLDRALTDWSSRV